MRLKKFVSSLTAGALLAIPSVAPAKRPFADRPSEPLALLAMHNFAACAVDRTPHGAEALLALDYRTREYRETLSRFAKGHEDCAPGSELAFSGIFFAGGIAERLLHNKGDAATVARLLAYDPARPALRARDENELTALCMDRQAPDQATALFATDPGSDAETAAFRALGPTLVSCVRAGRTVKLERPVLRAMLALAAWRLVSQPAAVPAAAGGK
ncbi:MAG: hypothetical protein JWO81_1335 [Alphaproteobacteria bacterium]|nr:hypothetical protein [Alphaproteobacteria bacterium]